MGANHFTKIPTFLIQDNGLNPTERCLVSLLLMYKDKAIYKPQSGIADKLNCTKNAVKKAIDKLVGLGVATYERKPTKCGRWNWVLKLQPTDNTELFAALPPKSSHTVQSCHTVQSQTSTPEKLPDIIRLHNNINNYRQKDLPTLRPAGEGEKKEPIKKTKVAIYGTNKQTKPPLMEKKQPASAQKSESNTNAPTEPEKPTGTMFLAEKKFGGLAGLWLEHMGKFKRKKPANWTQEKIALELEKIGRLEELTLSQQQAILEFIKSDPFWGNMPLSVFSLRKTNKESGLSKLDQILNKAKIEQPPEKVEVNKYFNDAESAGAFKEKHNLQGCKIIPCEGGGVNLVGVVNGSR